MSLFECLCCPKHHLRTAIVWDDPFSGPPCFQTYAHVLQTAETIADCLSRHRMRDGHPIAIFGHNCPPVLAAVLATLSLPSHDVGGVACVPMNPDDPSTDQASCLQRCGVELVLVELSVMEKFISNCERWVEPCLVSMDMCLMHSGIVIARLSSPSRKPVCRVSRFDGLDSVVLQDYRKDCDVSCYVCKLSTKTCRPPEPSCSTACPAVSTTGCPDTTTACPANVDSISTIGRPDNGPTSPSSIAYILHTSGTTGRPKMVRVPHCSILPNIVDLRARFNITPNDVIFNASPLTFDPSFVEIFLALSCGGQLLLVPEALKRSPSGLGSSLFCRHYASVLQLTPTLFYRFGEEVIRQVLGDNSHVRVLAFGGEACPEAGVLYEWKSPKNTTELYNVYGITEVSSWATCHRITPTLTTPTSPSPSYDTQDSPMAAVPLGHALLGTRVEIRNEETGGVVGRGQQGVIWIGGRYRVCLVDEETTPPADTMRCSGDHGYVNGCGQLVYTGRADRQIKRWGHRINLDNIQQKIVSALDQVSSCVLHSSPAPLPGGFLNKTTLEGYIILTPENPPTNPELTSTRPHDLARVQGGGASLLQLLREVLPGHCVPDKLTIVDSFPMTAHGKVDINALISNNTEVSHAHMPHPLQPPSLDSISSLLISIISTSGGLGASRGLRAFPSLLNSKLLHLGLTSFDIVRIANQIHSQLLGDNTGSHDRHMTMLTEKLLECEVFHVAEYLVAELAALWSSSAEGAGQGKRLLQDGSQLLASKRSKVTSEDMRGHMTDRRDHVIKVESWRRGQYFINGSLQHVKVKSPQPSHHEHPQAKCTLSIVWEVDTHKCVDASPLLVHTASSVDVVYVGSHSHLFLAVEVMTGRVVWRVWLGGRVESSACSSVCGHYVVVGCYDGHLYTLEANTGTIYWKFEPNEPSEPNEPNEPSHIYPIKSSPCVDLLTGHIWFGSHDHHLYAVDIYGRRMLQRLYPGGGSIFSTPCISAGRRSIYCATLQGIVAAYNMDSGELLWIYNACKPIFASLSLIPSQSDASPSPSRSDASPSPSRSDASPSPSQSDDRIVFGCVDGHVCLLSSSDGEKICAVNTGDSIFSSCCVIQCRDDDVSCSGSKILCGSHDKHLYCWNGSLELEWRTELDSELYSVPFCFISGSGDCMCVCCSADGVLYLADVGSGHVVAKVKLPGKVFSSPVCIGGHVIVGCRDNKVYSTQIITRERN